MVHFVMVCASNQNRSMACHKSLLDEGYDVSSFGTGAKVRLPGKTQDAPEVYDFGTPYEHMYQQLKAKDEHLYTRNGVLALLDRNRNVKSGPERWQDRSDSQFDVVFTFEQRVFDAIVEDAERTNAKGKRAIHILNIDVKDNPQEAKNISNQILTIAAEIEGSDDWENEIEDIIERFEENTARSILHTVLFY